MSNNGQVLQGHRGAFKSDPAEILLKLSDKDNFLTSHAYEHVLCTGATGCGKSSAVGKALLKAILQSESRWGALFCTTKIGDTAEYLALARAAGRADDVRIFGPQYNNTTNLLEMLYWQGGSRGAGDTQGVVNGFMELLDLNSKNQGAVGDGQEFWRNASAEFCTHAIELLAAAKERIQFQNIHRIIIDLPQCQADVKSADWQNGYINSLVNRSVTRNDLTEIQQHDLRQALEYFLGTVPKIDDRLRSGIVTTVATLIFPFLRGQLSRLCDGETNLTPEHCFNSGIIILDTPIHEYLSGRFVQVLYKYVWQKMVQKRNVAKYPTPLLLYIDEAQYFLTKTDLLFTSTARSARCSTVILTQNLDVLAHQMGKSDSEGLLGNFCTIIACQNMHGKTNETFSRMCGEEWSTTGSMNVSLAEQGGLSSGTQEHKKFNLEAHEFVKLKKPNAAFRAAEAVVIRGGLPFAASGMNHLRLVFPQEI